MATNFPTSLDALTNPSGSSSLTSPDHASQHTDANDAIEALQAKVGVNGSAVTTSLDYRVGALESTSAFRNKLINGDFSVNQRGANFIFAFGAFGPDRWRLFYNSAVSGVPYFYENSPITSFSELQSCKTWRCDVTNMTPHPVNYMYISQRIEDARTLAGQTVCLSFYATNFGLVGASLVQNFGTGGSPSAAVATSLGTISTFPASRSQASVTLPSVQSKNFGTNNDSYLELRIFFTAGTSSGFYAESGNLDIQYNNVSITGVQLERGSVPTTYDKRPPQTELALCQRYFQNCTWYGIAGADDDYTVNCFGGNYPVRMRTSPSIAVGATVAVGHHSTQPAVEAVNSQSVSFVWTGSSYRSIGYRVYQTFTASAEL
jgi:hypothetical protein